MNKDTPVQAAITEICMGLYGARFAPKPDRTLGNLIDLGKALGYMGVLWDLEGMGQLEALGRKDRTRLIDRYTTLSHLALADVTEERGLCLAALNRLRALADLEPMQPYGKDE